MCVRFPGRRPGNCSALPLGVTAVVSEGIPEPTPELLHTYPGYKTYSTRKDKIEIANDVAFLNLLICYKCIYLESIHELSVVCRGRRLVLQSSFVLVCRKSS